MLYFNSRDQGSNFQMYMNRPSLYNVKRKLNTRLKFFLQNSVRECLIRFTLEAKDVKPVYYWEFVYVYFNLKFPIKESAISEFLSYV